MPGKSRSSLEEVGVTDGLAISKRSPDPLIHDRVVVEADGQLLSLVHGQSLGMN